MSQCLRGACGINMEGGHGGRWDRFSTADSDDDDDEEEDSQPRLSPLTVPTSCRMIFHLSATRLVIAALFKTLPVLR